MPTWIVSSGAFWSAGTSGSISDGSERRVEQHRERHADRDEPDLPDRVALGEEQVAAEDRGRERDAELEQVPVRPAADDDRARDERREEQPERDRGEPGRGARQRASARRRHRAGSPADGGPRRRRTSPSPRRPRTPAAGPERRPRAGDRWPAAPRGRRGRRTRSRWRSRRRRRGATRPVPCRVPGRWRRGGCSAGRGRG